MNTQRPCAVCGLEFRAVSRVNAYCSRDCKYVAQLKRQRGRKQVRTGPNPLRSVALPPDLHARVKADAKRRGQFLADWVEMALAVVLESDAREAA